MINSEKAKSQYVTANVKTFAIGFEYGLDDLGNPEIAVTLNGALLQFGPDYTLSRDGQSIILANDVEEGQTLIIERDIDFVQGSDYQLGRIDPEQIEDDFDLSVMRDQQIRQELEDYKTVTDSELEDMSEQLVEHQGSIDTLTQNVSDLENNKADKSSVYTKGETDDKLALKADKADTYTKTDVDTKLTAKADKETVYTKTETDSKLASKADASTVYTKADVDGKLATKADKATTLAGYGIADAYTKEETDAKVSSVYRFKGSVATYSALPTSGQAVGDVWNVEDTGANYAWTGDSWDKLSETIDLTPYLTKDDAGNTYATKQEVTTGLDSKQDSLPDQTGHAGDFLFSDGVEVSWGHTIKPTLRFEHPTASNAQPWEVEVADGQTLTFYPLTGGNRTSRRYAMGFYAFSPGLSSLNLGSSGTPWGKLFAGALNNGADIAIPTTGGTIALVENTVAKEQGVDNAGKVLGIGEDGNVTPVEVAAGDYVEKAGDEMTGPLGFVNSGSEKAAIDIDDTGYFTLSFGDNAQPSYRANPDVIFPTTDGEQWLGSHDHRWNCVYTKYIYSEGGSTIAVPARVGDMLVASGGTEGQVLTKTADGYEWSALNVYSKEETDQQIQDAIGTIETALAEV